MTNIAPLQFGTSVAIGEGLRASLVQLQQENAPTASASSQSDQSAIRIAFKDRILAGPAFQSLLSAIQDFNGNGTRESRAILINKQAQFSDLYKVAQGDLEKLSSSGSSHHNKKAQVWQNVKSGLERLCRCVHRYSAVMDVLASSHPEIASLAWGAMKFLLAVSVNHQELKEKIVNHFADIGEQFKIVDHYIRLFPEAEMVEHVTGVYDQFATFLRLSVEWCRENALVKFFKNVALPYEARIKPTIDELNKCMTRVKERVDVHNTHAIAGIQYTLNALIDGLVGEKKLQVDAYATIGPLLQGFASDQRRLLDMADEQAKVRAIGNNIQSHPKASSAMLLADFQDLTTVSDQVKQCAIQSMHLEARYSYLALNLLDMVEVKTWLESDDSTLLWVNGFAYPQAGKWTTEFSIDVMLAVEQRSSIALFYFADVAADEILGSASNYLTSPKAIIHSFIVQLLRRLGDSAPLHSDWTTPKRWEEVCNTTEAAWKFLVFLLHSLSPSHTIVYFVLDSVDVLFNTSKQKHGLSSLLSRLSTLVTSSSSKGGTEECELPVTKVLCTAVGGREYTILFPVEATTSPISHFIAHVPHTFGHHKTLPSPRHLRKPRTRRLVRLPDSDDEFGFKPADSFEFSDEDELDLGSDEKETDLSEKEVRIKKERDTENSNTRGKGSQRSGLELEKVGGLDSDSSEELEFSDKDSSNIIQREHVADELQFSSEEDDLST